MAQVHLSRASREALRSGKYYRVQRKSDQPHLAVRDLGVDFYETFCGLKIEAESLEHVTTVQSYKGDECADCQNNVEVWVHTKDPIVGMEGTGRWIKLLRLRPSLEDSESRHA